MLTFAITRLSPRQVKLLTSLLWQVASHAQKYFIRLNSMNKKDKRRSSIHDITSAGLPGGQDITGALVALPCCTCTSMPYS